MVPCRLESTRLHVLTALNLGSPDPLVAEVVGLHLFFLGALLETKCDCVLAAEGKLARTRSFLFGLSEAADLLEGNRCSLLLPVTSQPVNGERRG